MNETITIKKKKRGILTALPEEQREALERWLFDEVPALTYAEARARLEAEFNVTVSNGPMCHFYHECASRRMMDRMVAAGQAGGKEWGPIGSRPLEPYQALAEVVGRQAFQLKADGDGETSLEELTGLAKVVTLGIKAHTDVARLRLRERETAVMERDVEVKDRDVTLKETKYRDAVAKETLEPEEGGLSDETIEKIRDAVGLM